SHAGRLRQRHPADQRDELSDRLADADVLQVRLRVVPRTDAPDVVRRRRRGGVAYRLQLNQGAGGGGAAVVAAALVYFAIRRPRRGTAASTFFFPVGRNFS